MGNKYSYSYNFINGELDMIQSQKDLQYIKYLKMFNRRKYNHIFSDPIMEPDRIREYIYDMRKSDPSSNLEARCSIWSIRSDRFNMLYPKSTIGTNPNGTYQNNPTKTYQNNPNGTYVSYQKTNQPSAPSLF